MTRKKDGGGRYTPPGGGGKHRRPKGYGSGPEGQEEIERELTLPRVDMDATGSPVIPEGDGPVVYDDKGVAYVRDWLEAGWIAERVGCDPQEVERVLRARQGATAEELSVLTEEGLGLMRAPGNWEQADSTGLALDFVRMVSEMNVQFLAEHGLARQLPDGEWDMTPVMRMSRVQ